MNDSVDPQLSDAAAVASADPSRPGGSAAAPVGDQPDDGSLSGKGMTGTDQADAEDEVPLLSEVVDVPEGAAQPATLGPDLSPAMRAEEAASVSVATEGPDTEGAVGSEASAAAGAGVAAAGLSDPSRQPEASDAGSEPPAVSAAAVVPDVPAKPVKTRKRPKPGERRLQILQALAEMLEQPRGERVTTAALAAKLSVSEAALYRHFASKAQMFEGLIEFIESTLFGLINQITRDEENALTQVQQVLNLLLTFAERNPGMTRVLVGDALINEDDRLQLRINQLIDRLELSLKQCYRQAVAQGGLPEEADASARADLALSYVLGRWARYAKGGFKRVPTESFSAQLPYFIS